MSHKGPWQGAPLASDNLVTPPEIVPAPGEDEVAAIVAALARGRAIERADVDVAPRLGRWGRAARPLLRAATGVDRWRQERSWADAARRV